MKKKLVLIVTLLVLVAVFFVACNNGGESSTTITNANFEQIDDNTVVGWTKSAKSDFKFEANKDDGSDQYDSNLGSRYAKLEKTSAAFDYIYQKVQLNKGTAYKLSAYINAEKISPVKDTGFRIGFLEDRNFIGLNITKSTSGWTTVDYYFNSATDAELTLTVGFGNPEVKAAGSVMIDNIKLEKVSTIPVEFVEKVEKVETLTNGGAAYYDNAASITFVTLLSILSVVVLVVVYILIRKTFKNNELINGEYPDNTNSKSGIIGKLTSNLAIFIYVILGAFLVRFLFIALTYGMNNSIEELLSIASAVKENGFTSIFAAKEALVAPTGLVLIYGGIGYLGQVLGIELESLGMSILTRLPQIIAEIYIVYAIYTYAAEVRGEKSAACYASIYAFLPIFFIFGSFFGSTTVILMAFMVAMFKFLLKKEYLNMSIMYTLSVLVSNYALLILPLILFYQIYLCVVEKSQRVKLLVCMAVSFVLFYAIGMWLNWSAIADGKIFTPFTKIYEFFTASKYLSTDTFNIYAIFGAANSIQRSTVLEIFNWLFVIALNSLAILQYVKDKNRLDMILTSALIFAAYSVLGAQATLHVLPMGLVLLLLYLIVIPENRIFAAFGAMSTLAFINIAQLASQCGYITQLTNATYMPLQGKSAFMIVFSILMLLSLGYLIYATVDSVYYNQISEMGAFEGSIKNEFSSIFKRKNNKKKRV